MHGRPIGPRLLVVGGFPIVAGLFVVVAHLLGFEGGRWTVLILAVSPGIVAIVFPVHVHRFYTWFHGEAFTRLGNEPRHFRNAGIFWLVFVAITTYWEWDR